MSVTEGSYAIVPHLLGELVDVRATPPADGDTLVWDEVEGQWKPGEGAGGNGTDQVLAEVWNEDAVAQAVQAAQDVFTPIDAVRLPPVTFTVPESGEVAVEYDIYTQAERTTTNVTLYFGAMSGGVLVPNSAMAAIGSSDNGILVQARTINRKRVGGLTPGAQETWTWGHMRGGAGGFTQVVWGGDGTPTPFGRARMRIIREASPFV